MFDVRTYGATGDGATDDSTAIKAALAAAGAVGGTVLFPPGTYATNSWFAIPGGVAVEATGATLRRIGSSTTSDFLQMGNNSNITIRGLALDTNGLMSGSAISMRAASNVLIENVTVRDATNALGKAVTIIAGTEVTVLGLVSDGPKSGVYVYGPSRFIRIERCHIRRHSSRGIYVVGLSSGTVVGGPSDVDIVGNTLTDPTPDPGQARCSIQADGSLNRITRIRAIGNKVMGQNTSYTDPKTPGTADQITLNFCDSVVYADNVSMYGGDLGIAGFSNTNVSIVGNVAMYNDVGGIWQGGNSRGGGDCVISGNVVMNNGQGRRGDRGGITSGISLNGVETATVTGNNVGDDQATPTQHFGITVRGVGEYMISGNVGRGLAGGLYWDSNEGAQVTLQEHRGDRDSALTPPTGGYWPRGAICRNQPTPGGKLGWIAAVGGGASKATWAAKTAYSVGDWVRLTNGRVLFCYKAGTSGATEPSTPSLMLSVTDGTVTWAYAATLSTEFRAYGAVDAAPALAPGTTALWFPGTSHDYVEAPQGNIPARLAAGIDIRWRAQWGPTGNANGLAGISKVFRLIQYANVGVQLYVSGNGTSSDLMTGSPVCLVPSHLGNPAVGDWYTARITYNAATGDWVSYTSNDNGAAWTQRGTGTQSSGTPYVPSGQSMRIGHSGADAPYPICGAIGWLDLRGFGDTKPIARADFTTPWPGGTQTDSAGNTWTIDGTQSDWITQP